MAAGSFGVRMKSSGCCRALKLKARRLKRELTAIFYAYSDPGTPVWPKIIIFVTLGYALNPIDLIPDFIPVLGLIDDLLLIPALLALSIRLIPAEIMDRARVRARREPLRLGKRGAAGVVFMLIWAGIVTAIVYTVVRRIRG